MKPELAREQISNYDPEQMSVLQLSVSSMLKQAICLDQGLANNGLWPNPNPDPVFINKVCLEHGHTPFFTYWLCLLFTTTADLRSPDRDHIAHKTSNIYVLALYRICVLTSG